MLIFGDRFQVKRIVVQPGNKLSLQKHFHRAEHWIVVAGTALVSRDGKETLLRENESVYCRWAASTAGESRQNPAGADRGAGGAYLGEDDIVRFQDTYVRN